MKKMAKWDLWMEGYDFVGVLASGRNEARFYGRS